MPIKIATIRILIADDHAILRRLLRAWLEGKEGDFEVVGEAADGAETIAMAERLQPDLLVLGLVMPGPPSADIISRLRRTAPKVRVVVLSASLASPRVSQLIKLGARACLRKTASLDELVAALRSVFVGGICLQARDAALLSRDKQKMYAPTDRELEVLHHLSEGKRNKEIASTLRVCESTVQFHLKNLFQKADVTTRTGLLAYARQTGWLD